MTFIFIIYFQNILSDNLTIDILTKLVSHSFPPFLPISTSRLCNTYAPIHTYTAYYHTIRHVTHDNIPSHLFFAQHFLLILLYSTSSSSSGSSSELRFDGPIGSGHVIRITFDFEVCVPSRAEPCTHMERICEDIVIVMRHHIRRDEEEEEEEGTSYRPSVYRSYG